MKKKILFIIILFSIFGCSQKFTHIEKVEIISSLDFSKYKHNNFLITPGEYGENYEALGIFTFTVYPEANYQKIGQSGQMGKWVQNQISSQEILDLAYETAIAKGADAITHFKIRNIDKTMHDGKNVFTLEGLEIEGLLIKRKN